MASRLGEIVLDCPDPAALASFWCRALGWQVVGEGEDHVELLPAPVPDADRLRDLRAGAVVPSIVLVRTADPKVSKNRAHLDLSPVDASHEDEVERLVALGATRVDVGQTGQESWTVLADPAGNEFCVMRSLAEGEFELG